MTLTLDRNDGDGVVLRDLPQEPGILYPSDDDEPMADTELQYYAIIDAVFALRVHLEKLDRAGTVRGNCALYYDPDNRTSYLAPDVLLAYGVAVPSKEGYAPWVYGRVPDLVMEMASPSTHVLDSSLKWERYAAMGIAEYWQYDPHHQYLTDDLLGWQLREGVYVPIPLRLDRPRGAWVGRSSVLDTDWGLDRATGILRLWNPVQQRWYLTVQEAETAHDQAAARADHEAARADQADARADHEAARADQADARADQADARADHEAARARAAEVELARLRSLLQQQGQDLQD